MPHPIIVGTLGRAFGVAGWIKVNSFTEPAGKILHYRPWLLLKSSGWEELTIDASRHHYGTLVVKLPGCPTREQARTFTNLKVGIWEQQLPQLATDYYWKELVGLQVVTLSGVYLGSVTKLIATGANDILVVEGEQRRLLPYISSVVKQVDLATKKLYVVWEDNFLL